MANTVYLKREVESYVRGKLRSIYGEEFISKNLRLEPGGDHEFDAVSESGRIVVAIKSSSGRTAGGRIPSGKIKDSIAELYYLSLVQAEERILVLTSKDFYEILSNTLEQKGRLGHDLKLLFVGLPPDMQSKVNVVQRKASEDVSPN